MTKKIEGKQAQATVSRKTKDGAVKESTENVGPVKMFEDPPCNVGMTAAMTINLGDYNSAKVQVSLHVPCKHEEIDETFDFAKEWVETKVNTLVEEIQEG